MSSASMLSDRSTASMMSIPLCSLRDSPSSVCGRAMAVRNNAKASQRSAFNTAPAREGAARVSRRTSAMDEYTSAAGCPRRPKRNAATGNTASPASHPGWRKVVP